MAIKLMVFIIECGKLNINGFGTMPRASITCGRLLSIEPAERGCLTMLVVLFS
jgi:hypothetical protein